MTGPSTNPPGEPISVWHERQRRKAVQRYWIITILVFLACAVSIGYGYVRDWEGQRLTPWEGYVMAAVIAAIWYFFIYRNRPR